jgi:hypothetical protein
MENYKNDSQGRLLVCVFGHVYLFCILNVVWDMGVAFSLPRMLIFAGVLQMAWLILL